MIAERLSPQTLAELEPILEAMVAEHERLLELAKEHRAALRLADPRALDSIVFRTGEAMSRVAELEDRRCRLLGHDPARAARGTSKPTITEIAALAGPEEGARLRDLGARLREIIEKVRHEHASIGVASRALADHMRGLMRQVAARLSHAGTYSSSGTVDPGRQQVVSGIDVKS